MLTFLYLVFLCSNFMFIKAEDSGFVNINATHGLNCTLADSYTFTEGQNVTLVIKPSRTINHSWWRLKNGTDSRDLSTKIHSEGTNQQENIDVDVNRPHEPTIHTAIVNKSMEGIWEFTFYMLRNIREAYAQYPKSRTIYPDENGVTYVVSACRTNVKIVPPAAPLSPPSPTPAATENPPADKTIIPASVVGAILVAVIVAQTAYIVHLKAKAQKLITLNTHNNLSKKSDAAPDDTTRYCSNPGQKMMKVAAPVDDDDNRDSVIYEAPNIEIPSNPRMPMQPPQPPAITTMPRTPKPDHNMRINSLAMLASAMNSPARSPMPENFPPNFQRSNQNERDLNVANRPRLPLPHTLHDTPHTIPKHNPNDPMFQEVYEEMEPMEENTYEPPPVINAMPPRLPMPPKKVPTGNLLDVKENTLKLRQGPPVIPKPTRSGTNTMIQPNELEQALRRRHDTMPKPSMTPMQQELAMRRRPTGDAQNELEEALKRRNNGDAQNELEEALRRRNNVKNVPIVSIPDPSSRESPKSKPPPPAKLKGPPIPQPVQEEIYYNENQASSDEEWTYEPLKPLNKIMNTPMVSYPDPSSSEPPKPRPTPSKPWEPPTPHPVQAGPPASKPRGAPIPHPVQEEIYYNENQASSDEEWIYEPLKPSHSYDKK